MGSSEAEVVEAAVVAEGDAAGGVDAVAADAVVVVVGAVTGGGFGSGPVDDAGWGVVGQGPVGSLFVVDGDERVEQALQLEDRLGWWLAGQPGLEGLLEAFDLAAGGGVVGLGVLLDHAEGTEFGLEAVAAGFAAGTKYLGLFFVAALAILTAWSAWRDRGARSSPLRQRCPGSRWPCW